MTEHTHTWRFHEEDADTVTWRCTQCGLMAVQEAEISRPPQ